MLLTILLNCDGLWAWPWPILLAFLLGAILGWLLHKILSDSDNEDLDYKQKYLDTKSELNLAKQNIKPSLAGGNALGIKSKSSDKNNYKQKYLNIKAELEACKENSNITSAFIADDSVKDDLTKIEGIGPKIQELLNTDGIWSWKQLATVSIERIQKILDNAGPRYRVHKPNSWPQQAEMCHKEEWNKLDKWQEEHKGGRL